MEFTKLLFTFVKKLLSIMNRRLLQFLQAENITQSQLADILVVARGSVSHILSGRNKPGYDFLESLLLHFPNLNLDWLMTGKGRMYRDSDAADAPDSASADVFPVLKASVPARSVERITVFYSDNTFQEFIAKE